VKNRFIILLDISENYFATSLSIYEANKLISVWQKMGISNNLSYVCITKNTHNILFLLLATGFGRELHLQAVMSVM
jgi:hypothetical protein